jgi:hypothetical protein
MPSKCFHIGYEDVRAIKQIVLYPGEEKFKLDAKTEAISLQAFTSDLLLEKTL